MCRYKHGANSNQRRGHYTVAPFIIQKLSVRPRHKTKTHSHANFVINRLNWITMLPKTSSNNIDINMRREEYV